MKSFIKLYINSYKGLSPAAWLLALVMLINRTGAMVIPFLSIYMASELGFSKPQIGLVLGCFGLGSVCGSWFGGWLTDRFGSYIVQICSLLLVIPLFIVLPNFKSFEGLAFMIFILTFVSDTFRPANSVSVARYAKPENITRAYSLNRMAINLGFSIGPALGGFLAKISYVWIFYGNAIGAATAAIVFFLFFHKRQSKNNIPVKSEVETKIENEPKRNAYKDGLFIVFSIICCMFSMAFFQLLSTLSLFYKEVYQLGTDQIGLLLGFSGFVIVVFEMLLVHIVEHRFTVAQIMLWGSIIAGVSYLMLNVDFGMSWLFLAMFILSTGEMLTLPFTATVAIRRADKNNQGAYMGFNSMSFAVANIFAAYLGTSIATYLGYHVLWSIVGTTLIICGICFYFIINKLERS